MLQLDYVKWFFKYSEIIGEIALVTDSIRQNIISLLKTQLKTRIIDALAEVITGLSS